MVEVYLFISDTVHSGSMQKKSFIEIWNSYN